MNVYRNFGARYFLAIMLLFGIFGTADRSFSSVPSDGDYQSLLSKLRSLKSYQVTVLDQTVLQPTTPGTASRTIKSVNTIYYQSPNLFALKNNGLLGGATIIADGKSEYMFSALSQEYAVRLAPRDIVASIMGGFSGKDVRWFSTSTTKLNGIAVTELRGSVVHSSVLTHVALYLRRSDGLPYLAVVSLIAPTSATGNSLKITKTELFTHQRINAPIPHAEFIFTPPNGAIKVDSIDDLVSQLSAGGIG